MPTPNNESQNQEMCHLINGVPSDLLIHIDDLVESEDDIPKYAKRLSERCNISLEEAERLIRLHLQD